MYHDAQGREHEDLEGDNTQVDWVYQAPGEPEPDMFGEKPTPGMTLYEIEQSLQAHLEWMAKVDDQDHEAWQATYVALAQVKQAQAAENIANILTSWDRNGVPVERVP